MEIKHAETISHVLSRPIEELKHIYFGVPQQLAHVVVPPKSKFYAQLAADASYDDKQRHRDNLEYLPDKSTRNRSVYYDKKTDEYTVGFAATDVRESSELKSDWAIIMGKYNLDPRFQKELEFIDSLDKNVNVSGHSLGSKIGQFVHMERPEKVKSAWLYGIGQYSDDKFLQKGKQNLTEEQKNNLHSFIVPTDVLSRSWVSQGYGNLYQKPQEVESLSILKEFSGSHSIRNWT